MKKISTKFCSLMCTAALLLSMTACGAGGTRATMNTDHTGGDRKHEAGETTDPTGSVDPTDPTDPTVPTTTPGYNGGTIVTSDMLTYPDHVATFEEVHPYHAPGSLKGNDATKRISEVEMDILHHSITCYADIEILFENPEKYGFEITDITWGDFTSIDQYDEEKAYCQEQLDKLLEIDYNSLNDDDRLCYDKMVYDLEENIYMYSYTAFEYYTMIFNFLTGPQCEILFVMDVYSFDTVEDAENYILLCKDIDRYYDCMCEYEETRASLGFASSDNSYEEAAKSFDNLVAQKDDCFLYESFEERLDNIKGLSSSDKDRLISEHEKVMKEVVFPEFQECADRMRALEGSGGVDAGLSAYKGGDAYYAMLTRRTTNKNATVQDSITALDKMISDTYNEYMNVASSGFGWYSEYMGHDYTKGDLNANLDFLRDTVKADFPSIPAHSYYTMDVPEVFQENFSPAAYIGYHLDNFDSNLLIVNTANDEKDFGTTVAHEAYPGHMYESIYTRTKSAHPYMYLTESIGYLEGWATYVEYYSMRYFTGSGVTDAMTLVKDEAVLGLLVSTRADYGINVENWSLEECVSYFQSFGFAVTEDSFSKFYTLLVTDPGYYAKYGMGYLWTQTIMDNLHANHPNATNKDIHTAYLDSLTGTFEQIEQYANKRLS
ncbi:MAG: DUF885 family protein [Clostridiales bacterium]|nr:DUF885 family protein [Clostridiales bacterium]